LVKKLKPLDKKLSPEIEQLLGHQLQEEKPSGKLPYCLLYVVYYVEHALAATQKDHSNKEKDTKVQQS
jgi:hypothetical protein